MAPTDNATAPAAAALTNLTFDLGHLLAHDHTQSLPLPPPASSSLAPSHPYFQRLLSAATSLLHALLALPSSTHPVDGRVISLPAPSFALPREKPPPKPRVETKWEKFAREKGIVKKKKRERMVWDEERREWRPRFGYKSIKSKDDVWAVEEKKGEEGVDPFAKSRKEKKERIKQEEKKRRGNLGRAEKKDREDKEKERAVVLTAVEGPKQASGKVRVPKKQLATTRALAQRSTASGGRFDVKLPDEPKVKVKGQKRKFEPVVAPKKENVAKSERERTLGILKSVLKGESEPAPVAPRDGAPAKKQKSKPANKKSKAS